MIRYLLDTNVLSETRKPKPHGGVLAWLGTLHVEQISVAAFSVGEIRLGIEMTRSHNPTRAAELEAWVEIAIQTHESLPMDSACFREWGRMVKGKSNQLQSDAMIAAPGKVHGVTVATRNVRDIGRFGVPVYNPFEFTDTDE